MSENYIKKHFNDIKKFTCAIENRLEDECCTMESVLEDNANFLKLAQEFKVNYVLINDNYENDISNVF